MKIQYIIFILLFANIFMSMEYVNKCEWGWCEYNFMYGHSENEFFTFMIIRSYPVTKICDTPDETGSYSCYYESEHKKTLLNFPLNEITKNRLIENLRR